MTSENLNEPLLSGQEKRLGSSSVQTRVKQQEQNQENGSAGAGPSEHAMGDGGGRGEDEGSGRGQQVGQAAKVTLNLVNSGIGTSTGGVY